MSNSNFSLGQLTEGIRQRHLGTQNRRLVEKWSRTGLLRGLDGVNRENMACMLENQASQLLREQNTLAGSGTYPSSDGASIRGFSNVAFPIVRRVFGGLIANDLVSIQPMSLPSGLLFYLDYTYGNDGAGGQADGESIYNSPTGKGIRSGSLGVGGMYDLGGTAYSRRALTEQDPLENDVNFGAAVAAAGNAGYQDAFGAYDSDDAWDGDETTASDLTTSGKNGRLLMFDPQISKKIDEESQYYKAIFIQLQGTDGADATADTMPNADLTLVNQIALVDDGGGTVGGLLGLDDDVQSGDALNVLRLNELGTWDGSTFTANPLVAVDASNACLKVIVRTATAAKSADAGSDNLDIRYPAAAVLDTDDDGSTLVVPSFESSNLQGGGPAMPEIDIKIESVAVTAQSRKLKAKWSPELAQDLNAYHSLDAEVELTQILSEQVALEIDREILGDLLTQANGANLYWSRMPGKFVNKETGSEVSSTSSLTPGPAFTGTVREWYETLIETVIDAANTIHRKTLRGSANFIVVGPDVATILESSVMYRPSYSLDGEGQVGAPMTIGADKVGTLSNRFTVYKDPYFPRNRILVGYKGGSYLETGYVYAPYVPLIVTPTIFQPEDFTPRKGVMTRYGKKMVRSDFYGTVTVLDLNVI